MTGSSLSKLGPLERPARRRKPMKRLMIVLAAVFSVALPGQATAGTLDQQQTEVAGEIGVSQSGWQGQTFTAGITGTLDQVDLSARQNLAPGVGLPLIVQIRTVSGGLPSTTVLSTTTTTVFNSVFTAFVSIPLSTPVAVTSGGQYAIAAGSTVPFDPSGSTNPTLGAAPQDPYGGGASASSGDGGATWLTQGGGTIDVAFKTYVVPGPAADCKNGGWQNLGFRNQGDCLKALR